MLAANLRAESSCWTASCDNAAGRIGSRLPVGDVTNREFTGLGCRYLKLKWVLFHGRWPHALRTTRCLIQTQNVQSLGSGQFREPLANGPQRCRSKFLRYFPGGFRDQKYIGWERGYKWTAHQRWQEILGQEEHRALILAARPWEWPRARSEVASRNGAWIYRATQHVLFLETQSNAAGAQEYDYELE